MTYILHTLYFIEARGYTIYKTIIYEDNQSTIRLEVNGRTSLVKKTKHISSIFSFIYVNIDKGEGYMEYRPT